MKYLYNGIELPPLPEWDKEKYPYAVISQFTELYRLTLYSTPVYMENVVFGQIYKSEQVCSAISYAITPKYDSTAWEANADGTVTDVAAGEPIGSASSPIWTNFELRMTLMTTGEISYLAASYPIDAETGEEITIYGLNPTPVPVPQLNPAALMQGFATMLSLRRNRT